MKTNFRLPFALFTLFALACARAESVPTPELRAAAVATKTANNLPSGLHLIVVQDDGSESPFAQAIVQIPISSPSKPIETLVEAHKSKVRFSGRVSVSATGELVVDGRLKSHIDFGSAKHLRNARVGECIVDETSFAELRLQKGVPFIVTLNRNANGPGDTETFAESSALLLFWK